MADNVSTSAGTFATDDIGGVHFERVKLVIGVDGTNDGDVHSSNPLPVNLRNISSVATQATLAEVTTFTNSTNTILAQPLSSNTFRVTIAVDDVGIGGGTQYVEANTTTLPTGTVMLWKSAVSTLRPVTSSFPLPVSSAPLTANIGTVSSLATEATLAVVSTDARSTNTMLLNIIASSTSSLWVQAQPGAAQSTIGGVTVIKTGLFTSAGAQVDSFGGGTQYVDGNTTTLPTGTVMMWKSAVSTIVPPSTSNPLPVQFITGQTVNLGTISSVATQATLAEVTTYTASSNALLSTLALTNSTRLNNISTFTNSSNTLLVQVSSNTASSNALLSTISARLAPVPTGIYTQPVPVSSNGLSVFMTLDADETEEQISATACTVYGAWIGNSGTAGAYVKLFNGTSSAIQVSSATPLIVIPIPGSSTQSLVGANYNLGGMGITFSTACCVAAVTGAANNNTTAPAESTIICNIFYKN